MILRNDYLNRISKYLDQPIIKILAGVRRSGKSTIFKMIKDLLISKGVDENHVVLRKYTDLIYDGMKYEKMYQDLIESFKDDSRYYILLDEVQEINGWEKVVNDLNENHNVDILITGSNSKLMSSEISTYLSGRYVLIPVYTLSFKEFLDFRKYSKENLYNSFLEYIQYGGFPLVAKSNLCAADSYQIVNGIYSSVVTSDIAKRHSLKNKELFDRVVHFIVENVGKTFSANSIVKFLKSQGRELSIEAIYNYIKWLIEAFIIYPCSRYDLKGKSVLKTQEKYYLSDISLKYCIFGFNTMMVSAMMENIIFLELKRRGYEVFIGKNGDKEIDFIGILQGEKIYIQVCREMPAFSSREINNLDTIKDHFRKYIVTMDILSIGNINGIEIIHIADFLLKEQW